MFARITVRVHYESFRFNDYFFVPKAAISAISLSIVFERKYIFFHNVPAAFFVASVATRYN